MSTVQLKVKATRPGKMFGQQVLPGDDVTEHFDPLNPGHMLLLETGGMKLVKEATPTAVTKTGKR